MSLGRPRGRSAGGQPADRDEGANEAIFRSVSNEISSLNATFTAKAHARPLRMRSSELHRPDRILPNEYLEVREDPMLFVLEVPPRLPVTETVIAKKSGYWIVRKDPGLPAAGNEPRNLT